MSFKVLDYFNHIIPKYRTIFGHAHWLKWLSVIVNFKPHFFFQPPDFFFFFFTYSERTWLQQLTYTTTLSETAYFLKKKDNSLILGINYHQR